MSKSKKKRHFMDDGQMGTYRKIRKPMPPPSKIINPKKSKRPWNWEDEIDENLDEDDLDI